MSDEFLLGALVLAIILWIRAERRAAAWRALYEASEALARQMLWWQDDTAKRVERYADEIAALRENLVG